MRIEKSDTTALVIDIQERLFPHMEGGDFFLQRTLLLLEGLKVLQVPVYMTEQYPKGLGPTLESLKKALPSLKPIEKITFSCCDEPTYLLELERSRRQSVIVCGIEAHVCVLQTVIDLVTAGFHAVVAVDCIASRRAGDKEVALERMKMEGALLTTGESILFELTRRAGNDTFKAISRLVK